MATPTTERRDAVLRWGVLLLLGFVYLLSSVGHDRPSSHGVSVDTVRHLNRSFTVVTVDLDHADLSLHWRRETGEPYGTLAELCGDLAGRGRAVLFAANAGIFDPAYTPVGLHVEAGREVVPLNSHDAPGNFYLKPNGVFLVTQSSDARVVESTEYPAVARAVRFATQSGPLLVRDNRIHPALNPASTHRTTRSAVGVRTPRAAVFVLSDEPVTFYELATLLRDRLGCADALYLDGTISRFHAADGVARDISGAFAGMIAVTGGRARPVAHGG